MTPVQALSPHAAYAAYISATSILRSTDQNLIVSKGAGPVEAQAKLPPFSTSPTSKMYTVSIIVGTTPSTQLYYVNSDWEIFQNLIAQWHQERGVTSSVTQMAMCKSYQRIIGMGDKAIPLIMRQLENEGGEPDHWFWALHAITAEDPVPQNARGDMSKMAAAWLDWGRRNGHAW
jgi:hypothetical protein